MAEAAQAVLIGTVTALAEANAMPVARACTMVGLARSTYYRLSRGYQHYRPVAEPVPHRERRQPAALTEEERGEVVRVLTADPHADDSVVQTYWDAFDAGALACSQRTFYRIAKSERLVGDRRRTRRHGASSSRTPVVAAAKAGDLWSWDITELRGPSNERYYLYLIIDVFSRYPVGWCVEKRIAKKRAVTLFREAIGRHGVPKVVHSDNGSTMRSEELLDALQAKGVVASFSRPRVSDDNPFSESLFKTIKYDLSCPDRFSSLEHAQEWTARFLHRYATKHRHSGLARHTPASVFFGTAHEVRRQRQDSLDGYYARHPKRFRRPPTAPELPRLVGINTRLLSQTG